jgi:DnaJ-class molecular chaperone
MPEQPPFTDQDRSPEMARKNTERTPVKCETCNGYGYIIVTHFFTRKEHRETCTDCRGTGKV